MEYFDGKVRIYRKKDGLIAKALEKRNSDTNTNEEKTKLRVVVFKDTDKRKRKAS
jgi:hypothetical protein